MIDSLLEEHVMKQEIALDKCKNQLKKVEQEIADNPEKESELEETYNYWLETKKTHFELLCNAKEAFDDFKNHDWSQGYGNK